MPGHLLIVDGDASRRAALRAALGRPLGEVAELDDPTLLTDRVARLRRGPTLALMVHETYVDMKNVRWALMGAWQRLQLAALRQLTDLQFCSTESWMRRLTHSSWRR